MRVKAAGLCGIAIGSLALGMTGGVQAEDSIGAALTGGKVSLDLRYRYEQVDQDKLPKKANASTLRTALGYTTGKFYDFSAMVEFENVSVLGAEHYNSTVNNKAAQYATVVDPKSTELNQGYLSYTGLSDTTMQLGRQRITLDNQRFVGNSGWRQNEQTFNGFEVVNKSLPDTQITYAYLTDANRVTGDDASNGDLRMKSHIINVAYSGLGFGALTGYAYLLDNGNIANQVLLGPASASTQTLGLRFNGATKMNDDLALLYTAEYARQGDYADNPASYHVNYLLGELGATFTGITVKYGYEKLGSDRTHAVQTPLATLHAFNGWADMFLTTPTNGLVDQYLSVGAKPMDINLAAVYHDFATDKGAGDYGKEWDLMASKTFEKKYTLGAKYANFSADSASAYVDTKKFWLWGEVKF